MLPLAALLCFAPLQQQPDTLPRPGAYLDAAAREWIAGARARQQERDRSVGGYTATVQERAWAGLRTLGRDRTLASMRTSARVEWERDGGARVTVTGSRMIDPEGELDVIGPRDTGPANLAYDPADAPLVIRLSDSAWVRHPLAPGSEAFYRFRTGPQTSIALPGGRTVRVVEIGVEPRRADPRLLRGSLWLDADSHAPVRLLFRPAAPLKASLGGRVANSEGRRNIGIAARVRERGGGWFGSAEAEVEYVTVEYGLYEGRWWMLRSLAAEGVVRARALGIGAAIPVRWERAYSDYQVRGAPAGEPPRLPALPLDTATAERPGRSCPAKRPAGMGCRCRAGSCRLIRVEVPTDTAALLASAELPPSYREEGERTLAGTDVDELVDALERRLPPLWALRSPRVGLVPPGPALLRYNRVEGFSVGAGADADFGPLAADLRVRMGTADHEPVVELGIARQGGRTLRLAGYRRLDAVDPALQPFGAGNSLGALLWGSDVGDYFRTAGVELLGAPAPTERPWYEWRLFAERQSAAERNTEFSVWDAVGGGGDFRPNIAADRADQLGASLALRSSWEGRPGGPRAGAELWAEGSGGTFDFLRPRLRLSGGTPLPGGLWGSLEGAAGGSVGHLPTQSLWYVGGPATLRGYDGNAARGDAFWRGRGELATAGPLTRVGVFADAGWAGDRGGFGEGRTLASIGVGASLLDGWLRLDFARALVAPTGWGLYLGVEPAR